MRFDTAYDVVMEMDFPLGESSDLAYDTWGREIRRRLSDLNCRVVRSRNHVKISAPRVHAAGATDISFVIGLVLGRVAAQAPADINVRIHELEPQKREMVDQTMSIEELL